MKRRDFLAALPLGLAGCGLLRVDPMHVFIRSPIITSFEEEQAIISKAKLGWTEDGRIRVLHVRGTPYERGYQHGHLLQKEVQANLGYLYEQSLEKFRSAELFHEAYERARPFIRQEHIDEMHGLAHGSKLPLHVIHAIHILPSITEWGGKKRLKAIVKSMMDGSLGTSCSNFAAEGAATKNGHMYALRVLDWGLHRISRLHEFPLITVSVPETGIASANIGWVGFLGAISGMNAEGITLGEMGYGDPENETLAGEPMPFLLRRVMSEAHNLTDVRSIIGSSEPTCSFSFLMADGKAHEAELYIRDASRFLTFKPGQDLLDEHKSFPALPGIVYGGHYQDRMTRVLSESSGTIDPELIMKTIVPEIAMKSNFQNVIYDATALSFHVNNAKSMNERAAEQPYTFFDLKKALTEFR